jgi:toxin ParE1/3/4
MARVTWTPTAEKSLDQIYDFIAIQQQNPSGAIHVLREIERKCDLYADQPEMGDRRHELVDDLRCFPVGDFVVFYRPQTEGIVVVLVIHGARDIPEVARRLFLNHN